MPSRFYRASRSATESGSKKEPVTTGPKRAYGRAFGDPAHTDEERSKRWKLSACVRDDTLELWGSCPLCTHQIDDFVSLSPEWVKGFEGGQTEDVVTVVQCNCSEEHAGRPDEAIGCGGIAVATITLTASETKGRPTAAVTHARPATARDRSWDDEASKWEQAMSTRLSETAEKWGQTVAALFGLFGLGLVLEGDRVENVISSSARWPWWVLVVLLGIAAAVFGLYYLRPRLRGSGEPRDGRRASGEPRDAAFKWAGLGALLLWAGTLALGLVGGQPKAGVTFGVVAGFAAGLALAATSFAGLAAQGSPTWVSYLTGNRMRALRLDKADRTVRYLRRARVTTALAIIALGSALAVLWYSPVAPAKQKVRVVLGRGLEPCGELVSREGPGIAIDPEGETDDREQFDLAEVQQVLPVDSCTEQ